MYLSLNIRYCHTEILFAKVSMKNDQTNFITKFNYLTNVNKELVITEVKFNSRTDKPPGKVGGRLERCHNQQSLINFF